MIENVWVDYGLQYGLLDGRPLTLDVIQPKTPNQPPLPAIVYVVAGTDRPTGPPRKLVRLAASGNYVCARVKCHNFVDISHPTGNPECADAVRWLAAKTSEYNINPGRTGVWIEFPDGDFVCTLERGSTDVLASSMLERPQGGIPAGPPLMTSDVQAFFDKNLRGEKSKPAPMARRGRGRGGHGGGGRGRMF